ncbi:LysR family transcriptional regulator [Phenylobacterium sp. J367]|uniref:LysR family transcriptional regulator n=1 Tax=Phenylobacterium sp. J367 TaxID=2898435 RepID=UPI0035B02BDA|nr:LysR family transcriptional regulator [Phenylobacterium sp. J367]
MQHAQFDLSHLRCFVAVAEELHFGRAAARLNMTQPPLSRQIQVLERILDVALLERNSRSVRLTAAGRSFLPEAQRILRQTDIAVAVAKRADAGKIGTLRIGFTAATAYSYLPSLVMACQEALPDIGLVLNETVTRDQIEALVSGQIDIGLLRPPVSRSELSAVRVTAEPMVVALPEGHHLASHEAIRPKDLQGESFIMYSSHDARYFHDLVVSVLEEHGVFPRHVQHMVQIHSILALVRAGVGLAVVPASAAALRYERVVFRPLATKRPRQAELYLVWRKDTANQLVEHVVELAQSLVKEAAAEAA